tara:strand:- start:2367 stop:3593 length:1227 start_codon:yes stop_codon:yes gene_type:complete
MKRAGCIHCGRPLRRGSSIEGFCCAGCQQVHALIQGEGLGSFYTLQDQLGRPVEKGQFSKGADVVGLRAIQEKAEADQRISSVSLRVTGMTCPGCVWLIEEIAGRMTGCREAQAGLQEGTLTLSWEKGRFDLGQLAIELNRFNYGLSVAKKAGEGLSAMAWRTLLCGVLAVNALWLEYLLGSPVLQDSLVGLFRILALSVVVLSSFVGAPVFIQPAVRAMRIRVLHYDIFPALAIGLLWVHLLIELIVGTAAGIGWGQLPGVLCFLVAGRWLQYLLWKKLREKRYSRLAMNGDSALRWRRIFFWQSLLIALACLLLSFTQLLSGTGWTPFEKIAALVLAPAFFPLATVARYEWRTLWMRAGIVISWFALVAYQWLHWPPLLSALLSAFVGLAYVAILLAPASHPTSRI